MKPICPDQATIVETRIDRVLTQYRESPNFLFMLRTYLNALAEAYIANCDLPEYFNLDVATGDQLTLIGKRLGWPRCHCVCIAKPVYGVECVNFGGSGITIAGPCDVGTWQDCNDTSIGDICIDDDEIYRTFLRVRRYQILNLYDIENLTECIELFYGPTATVLQSGFGRVVIAPGRELSSIENLLLPLVARVLPIAPGIKTRFHLNPTVAVAGFGDGWGGPCEPVFPDGVAMTTQGGVVMTTQGGVAMVTSPLTAGAPMLCEIDVKPYSC